MVLFIIQCCAVDLQGLFLYNRNFVPLLGIFKTFIINFKDFNPILIFLVYYEVEI